MTTVVLAVNFLLFAFNGISIIELASIFVRLKLCSFSFAAPGYLRSTLVNIVINDSLKHFCCYIKTVNQGNTLLRVVKVEGDKGSFCANTILISSFLIPSRSDPNLIVTVEKNSQFQFLFDPFRTLHVYPLPLSA